MDLLGPIILLTVAAAIVLPWVAFKALRPLPIGVRIIVALPVILSPYLIGNSYQLSNQTIIKVLPFSIFLAFGAFWSLLPRWWVNNVAEGLRSPYLHFDFDDWDRRRRDRM
jgi:hypothetical protein